MTPIINSRLSKSFIPPGLTNGADKRYFTFMMNIVDDAIIHQPALAVVLRIRKDRTAHDSRSAPLPKPVFLWVMMDEKQLAEVIKYVKANPEEFKEAKQWYKKTDFLSK